MNQVKEHWIFQVLKVKVVNPSVMGRDKELSKTLLIGRDLKLSKFKHGIVDR